MQRLLAYRFFSRRLRTAAARKRAWHILSKSIRESLLEMLMAFPQAEPEPICLVCVSLSLTEGIRENIDEERRENHRRSARI